MGKFMFDVEIQVQAWEKQKIAVEAENIEEAKKILQGFDPENFIDWEEMPEGVKLVSKTISPDPISYYSDDGDFGYQIIDNQNKETVIRSRYLDLWMG